MQLPGLMRCPESDLVQDGECKVRPRRMTISGGSYIPLPKTLLSLDAAVLYAILGYSIFSTQGNLLCQFMNMSAPIAGRNSKNASVFQRLTRNQSVQSAPVSPHTRKYPSSVRLVHHLQEQPVLQVPVADRTAALAEQADYRRPCAGIHFHNF